MFYIYNVFMIKVEKIIKFMNHNYPNKIAEEWDNVGLIFGSKNLEVKNILIALDLTTDVLKEVLKNNVNLIVTHHPFLFDQSKEGLKNEYMQAPYKKAILESLQENNIALYVAHTNFDKTGMPKALAEALKILKIHKIPKGYPYGFIGDYNSDSDIIAKKINDLGVCVVKKPDQKIKTKKVAFFPGGSGGDFIQYINSKKAGANLMVISEMKHHIKVTAKEMNIPFLVVEHDIEKVIIPYLTKVLNKKFKDEVNVIPYGGDK